MRFFAHPALGRRSPSGRRSPVVAHLPAEAVDPQVGEPPVGEAGSPAPPVEPVLGAGEAGHPQMDVVIDGAEPLRGAAHGEARAPAPQHGVETGDNLVQRSARPVAGRALLDPGPDGGHGPRRRPLVQIPVGQVVCARIVRMAEQARGWAERRSTPKRRSHRWSASPRLLLIGSPAIKVGVAVAGGQIGLRPSSASSASSAVRLSMQGTLVSRGRFSAPGARACRQGGVKGGGCRPGGAEGP